jgi:hypothetical protein
MLLLLLLLHAGGRQLNGELRLALALQLPLVQVESGLCHSGQLALRDASSCAHGALGQVFPAQRGKNK